MEVIWMTVECRGCCFISLTSMARKHYFTCAYICYPVYYLIQTKRTQHNSSIVLYGKWWKIRRRCPPPNHAVRFLFVRLWHSPLVGVGPHLRQRMNWCNTVRQQNRFCDPVGRVILNAATCCFTLNALKTLKRDNILLFWSRSLKLYESALPLEKTL